MCNIDKIKSLAKSKGFKLKYICSQLGEVESYLGDVKAGRRAMYPEKLEAIAEILGTTVEYLTDQTDDPEIKKAPSTEPGSIRPDQLAEINRLWAALPPDKQAEAERYLRYLIETADKR